MEVILFVVALYVAFRILQYLDRKSREHAGDHSPLSRSIHMTQSQMSEAAAVIQRLLESYAKLGLSDLRHSPADTTDQLIIAAWKKMPDALNGKSGHTPHKLAAAAIALANGFQIHSDNRQMRCSLFWALAEILKETEANSSAYNFSKLDQIMLSNAMTEFIVESKRLESSSVISSMSNT